jgi:transposase
MRRSGSNSQIGHYPGARVVAYSSIGQVDARGTKSVPGRKSDVQECQWLLKLHTYGLLRSCFLPAPEIHGVRTVWRLRDQHVKDAGRCIQHMQKALIEMNVQLPLP